MSQKTKSEQAEELQEDTPSVSKNKGGRPVGSTKKFKNGAVSEDDIYLYVPKDTIPKEQLNRFLTLVDKMISSLGPETVSDLDVEEIALYYRDRLICDNMHREFSLSNTTDTGMVIQMEKFNKSLEQRKQNLGARFIDKGKRRTDNSNVTLVDLIEEFSEAPSKAFESAQAKLNEIVKNKQEVFTNTEEYMETHIIAGYSPQVLLEE